MKLLPPTPELVLQHEVVILSKNHLARKMQVLQEYFLQDLQDLALNLVSLTLKMKLFLQELKNPALTLQELARKMCKIIFLQDFNQKN